MIMGKLYILKDLFNGYIETKIFEYGIVYIFRIDDKSFFLDFNDLLSFYKIDKDLI